jgi:hypothetical protein
MIRDIEPNFIREDDLEQKSNGIGWAIEREIERETGTRVPRVVLLIVFPVIVF